MTPISDIKNETETKLTATDMQSEESVSYTDSFVLSKDDCQIAINKINEGGQNINHLRQWLQTMLDNKADTDELVITQTDADTFWNKHIGSDNSQDFSE